MLPFNLTLSFSCSFVLSLFLSLLAISSFSTLFSFSLSLSLVRCLTHTFPLTPGPSLRHTRARSRRVVRLPLSLSVSSRLFCARRSERRVRQRIETAPPPRLGRSLAHSLARFLPLSLCLGHFFLPVYLPPVVSRRFVGASRDDSIGTAHVHATLTEKWRSIRARIC